MIMKTAYSELQSIAASLVSVLRNGYALPHRKSSIAQSSPQVPPRVINSAAVVPTPTRHAIVGGIGADGIEALSAQIRTCRLCPLCESRNKSIPGTGSMHPLVLVIGEAPGSDEDRLGLPFVGAAGQFLDKWLEAIGLSRYTNVFITSLVRCRALDNHSPQPDEITACAPYLNAQIDLLKPIAMVTVGTAAASYLSGRLVEL